MIYYPRKSLFIHIPRTSGIGLTQTVMTHLVDMEATNVLIATCAEAGGVSRHARACALRYMLPDYAVLEKFCIMRNPWRMVESTYLFFVKKSREMQEKDAKDDSPPYRKEWLRFAEMSFPEFVLSGHFSFLSHGFWHHWCCDPVSGAELGVGHVMFEDMHQPEVWQNVCRMLQLAPGTPRGVENASPKHYGDRHALHWTPTTRAYIHSRCTGDFTKFHYSSDPGDP